MPTEELEADYVIVGAGASAMSFTDVILAHSDRSVIMVDRHAQPGGHWNHAYSFVRLHQPSAFYGVDSRQLGRDVRDTDGSNAGLFELATGRQVLTYFDEVMREQFLPTGRVTFLPMSEWLPDGTAVSQLTGRWTRLKARRRVVDARYIGSEIPSLHTPRFTVDPRVPFVPINGLTGLSDSPSGYVVVGGGKTGADACLWLLEQGVGADRIAWVRPRDIWFINRERVQPDAEQLSAFADLVEASAQARDADDLVARLEQVKLLLRTDPDRWPTMFRGATASPAEVQELRRIERVIRLGHVTSIEPGVVHLERGDVPIDPGWLFVDCTAEGVRSQPLVPIFQPDRITLQYVVLFGSPTYSAALIARVELASDDDHEKNEALWPIPVPNGNEDVAAHILARLEGPPRWERLPGVEEWNDASRLNPGSWALAAATPEDERAQAAIVAILERGDAAQSNLLRMCTAGSGSR